MFSRMSKLIASVLMTFFVSTAFAAYQDPLDVPAHTFVRPEGGHFNAVAVAGKRIVAAGRRGVIVYSDDAGQRWTQAAVPVSVDLTAMHFVSPDVGWAVGHGAALLKTNDGGKTWVKRLDGRQLAKLLTDYYANESSEAASAAIQIANEGPVHPFLDVWFASEKVGYVVGAFNLILRTDDGGDTWQPWLDRVDNPRGLHLYSVRGVGDQVYVAGEQGLVMKLNETASRFVGIPTPYEGSLFRLVVQPDSVMAFGLRGTAFGSDERGESWKRLDAMVETSLTAAEALPAGRVVIGTQGGELLVGTDRGGNFALVNDINLAPVVDVAPFGQDAVAYAGMGGVGVVQIKK